MKPIVDQAISGSPAAHFPIQTVTQTFAGLFQIVVSLQAHPECLGSAEIARQTQGAVRRDCTFTMHDFVDATRRNADVTRQPVLVLTV